MNCQKGEWAYVVRDDKFPECIGMPVEIIEAYGVDDDGDFCWVCKPAYPCRGYSPDGRTIVFNSEDTEYPDAWLRPIRPEADPVTTDVVAGVEA